MVKSILRMSALTALLTAANLFAAGRAKHIVVIVWDGMRPDFITPEHTPALCRLASNGVFFANHHSVYCSATDVNGTALATGAYPSHSGILANNMFFQQINSNKAVVVADPSVIIAGDQFTGGGFIARPTIAEILREAGKSAATAGSKTVALIHDRRARADDCASVCLYEDGARPPIALAVATNQLGNFPKPGDGVPNLLRDEWTRRALTEVLWSNGMPAYSLLWLSEPDASQHASGPGSERSLAAIESTDRQLAAVLVELDKRKLREETDVFVVSDHGFSTINQTVDVAAVLNKGGFHAQREFKTSSQTGDILVVSQGGSDLFYVIGHDADVTHRLVKFLQQQDFAGVIFSLEKLPGTFSLADAHLDRADNQPDVVLSMRWSPGKSTNGTPGLYYCDGGRKSAGAHTSLSKFDMHNTLVAAGPDFKRGFTNNLPSANTDLAPTILRLLSVKQTVPMDGRVLSEALTVKAPKMSKPTTRRLEAHTSIGEIVWQQYLQTSKINDTVYLDEGNGNQSRLK